MDGGNEERVALKFLFQGRSICNRKVAKGLCELGSELIKLFRWYFRFRDGRELVEDDEGSGLRKLSRTEVNIAADADLVKYDGRVTSRMIAESLNIPKTLVLRILKEDLGKRKYCALFVPHSLTPEQREDRVTFCQDIIVTVDADRFFLNKIITGDETWCFAYDPETKRQSSEWVGEISPRPKKLKFQRSRIKTTLIIFFSTFKV